ncbi:MAG TPA: hypothetical protein VMX54_10045 [Vicinamibacteria bacterium]|nr:hypothetical protein [Vicinamibacteria bacterium]
MAFPITAFLLATTAVAASDEPFNYATFWANWSAEARYAYVEGVYGTIGRTYVAAVEELLQLRPEASPGVLRAAFASPKARKLLERVSLSEDIKSQIPEVVTDLYRDPANAFIDTTEMVYIARDKLGGKDVQRILAAAREFALEYHRIDRERKQKK